MELPNSRVEKHVNISQEKVGSRVVQLSKFSDFWAPAGQFTCVHPALGPWGDGLRFKLAYNRGVVQLKTPRASVMTRSRSQVGLQGCLD